MIYKFISRILLFLAPILIIFLPLEYYLFNIGESLSAKEVLILQGQNPRIKYQRGIFSQQFNVYKYEGINLRKPEILIVGSSRVMQFRDLLFHPFESRMYNAGGILQCEEDLESLCELIIQNKIHRPKVMLIGLDPWWYKKDNIPNYTWLKESMLKDDKYSGAARIAALKKLFSDINNFIILNNEDPNFIGSFAKIEKAGFRKDGSKSISPSIISEYIKNPHYRDRENPPVIERIKKLKTSRFSLSEIASKRLEETLKSLEKLKSNGIEVIVYLPPFSSECFQALDEHKQLKEWWTFYKDELCNKISKEFICIKTICPKELNLSDEYFLDGFHPSEVFVAHQFLKLLKELPQGSYLNQIDKIHLEILLNNEQTIPLSFQIED